MHIHTYKQRDLFPYFLIFLEIAIFLSNDMYLPSMPAIGQELHLTQVQIQYTLTLWFLGSSALQLILGPVSDRFGRRWAVLLGGVVYVIATAICAMATDFTVLLSARFVQGATICAVLVAGTAAVHELYETKQAIKIFAVINAVTILAPAFGPLFGALIVQYGTWRDIFWLLFAMGFLATLLLLIFMPESNHTQHKMHLKVIFRDYRSIFSNKHYMLPTLSYCLLVAIFFLWMFEAPFLMIKIYGFSSLYYGLAQTLIFGCFFIGERLTNWILNNYTLHALILHASFIVVIGSLLFVATSRVFNNMPLSIFCMMIVSTGASMLFAPLSRVAIEASNTPMGRRVAVSSTILSLFGAAIGWLVTLIVINSLATIASLILIFVSFALLGLLFVKISEPDLL